MLPRGNIPSQSKEEHFSGQFDAVLVTMFAPMLKLGRTCFNSSLELGVFVGSQILAAGGFSPPRSIRGGFLGLRCTIPARHEPERIHANCVSNLLSADGGLKAACRHDCLPHLAADCIS
jgi:hypothetical protein